jgi:hypothetical protein
MEAAAVCVAPRGKDAQPATKFNGNSNIDSCLPGSAGSRKPRAVDRDTVRYIMTEAYVEANRRPAYRRNTVEKCADKLGPFRSNPNNMRCAMSVQVRLVLSKVAASSPGLTSNAFSSDAMTACEVQFEAKKCVNCTLMRGPMQDGVGMCVHHLYNCSGYRCDELLAPQDG